MSEEKPVSGRIAVFAIFSLYLLLVGGLIWIVL